jgi:hypothetical protein
MSILETIKLRALLLYVWFYETVVTYFLYQAVRFQVSIRGAVGTFVQGVVGMVIAIIVIIAVIPTIVTTVGDTNTTAWNFTGSAGAISLFNLIPFVVIAGALLVAVSYGLSMRNRD